MIGLLDGDIIVFRCGFACERNVWHLMWGKQEDGTWEQLESFDYKKQLDKRLDEVVPGQYSREKGVDYDYFSERQLEPLSFALQNVKTLIAKVAEACSLDPEFDMRVYLSPYKGHNFRQDIAKSAVYKGNRKDEHRPTYEKEIRDYIIKNYDTYVAEGEEADDLLGINAMSLQDEAIMITLDKDLDMIPGLKYNWLHEVHYAVDQQEADRNFAIQVMSGDATDNIPGLPRVGPATGRKVLAGLETYDEMMLEVARQYMARSPKEDWYEYMLEQARLIWIRRNPDELWEPPETVKELTTWEGYTEEELTL